MEHKDFSAWRVKPKSDFKLHDIDTLPKTKDLPTDEEWESTLKKLGDKLNNCKAPCMRASAKVCWWCFKAWTPRVKMV
jgi:hypothetical protein